MQRRGNILWGAPVLNKLSGFLFINIDLHNNVTVIVAWNGMSDRQRKDKSTCQVKWHCHWHWHYLSQCQWQWRAVSNDPWSGVIVIAICGPGSASHGANRPIAIGNSTNYFTYGRTGKKRRDTVIRLFKVKRKGTPLWVHTAWKHWTTLVCDYNQCYWSSR